MVVVIFFPKLFLLGALSFLIVIVAIIIQSTEKHIFIEDDYELHGFETNVSRENFNIIVSSLILLILCLIIGIWK